MKILSFMVFSVLFLMIDYDRLAWSGDHSIEYESQPWSDTTSRDALLAIVPEWPANAIQTVFGEYLHPESHGLPGSGSATAANYNALFIHSFWGPLENPFVKFQRPAKIFVFISKPNGATQRLMAPLVHDESDGRFYVFERGQLRPTELNTWIAKKSNNVERLVKFNICTGYAVSPSDSCNDVTFDEEIDENQSQSKMNQNLMSSLANSSAKRAIDQDWNQAKKENGSSKPKAGHNAIDSSVYWDDLAERREILSSVVEWQNWEVIKNNFEQMRDLRYWSDKRVPGFARRISWLYPDDGCWTRATAMIKDFFGPKNNFVSSFSRPSKVFVFGNLCVNTSNSPYGRATWWYHTAPAIRDAETKQTYVLDPSVNPFAPTTIEDWMSLVSAHTENCAGNPRSSAMFSICNGYGTQPYESCDSARDTDFGTEIRAMLLQPSYQEYERDRQLEMGRDPSKVLGDMPPW